ncbi:carboxypeptidase-like regulatory domain-containing protein [Planctomicrobium piriforme]|uniref:Carboxypeptidase regulatory-like domain-containing protein n=1 Tax=Planctomicrobium piriforme TaxID=1576369 RepID=A0A1I3HXQ6_9PLAN|nr:carboxypeptidase-like regulatory domain-containing protein [Planctomicrobium piriforme]SFI40357.1 Carboxypeptidase regulatory-like domain-containing protein [Planctomicrobium piriforme]
MRRSARLLFLLVPFASSLLAAEPQPPALTGRVVNADGQPIADASVDIQYTPPFRRTTRSDRDGRFSIPIAQGQTASNLQVLIGAPEHGYVSVFGDVITKGKIRLPPERVIRGRLLDQANAPLPNVRLRVIDVLKYPDDGDHQLETFLAGRTAFGDVLDRGRRVLNSNSGIETIFPWQMTGPEGEFEIHGIGTDCLVGIFLYGESAAAETIYVRTDDGPVAKVPRTTTHTTGEFWDVYPYRQFLHEVKPSVPIRGTVTQAETKLPLTGITITPVWFDNWQISSRRQEDLQVTTDALGRYELIGVPLHGDRVFAAPPVGSSFVAVERGLKYFLGRPQQPLDFQMPEGVKISGRVTDSQTGKPLSGGIAAFTIPDNPSVKAIVPSRLSGERSGMRVDQDGKYEITVLPGAGIITFRVATEVSGQYQRGQGANQITNFRTDVIPGKIYFRTQPHLLNAEEPNLLVEFNAEKGTPQLLDLKVGEPRTDVPLYFTSQNGGTFQVYYSNQKHDENIFSLAKDGSGTIRFFGKQGRATQAVSSEHDLAGWTYVEATDKSATIDLVSAAQLSGRLLVADGSPLAGARLHDPYDYDPTTRHGLIPSQPGSGYYPVTDDEGRFKLVGLAPGLPLTIQVGVSKGSYLLHRRIAGKDIVLEPGGSKDLGDLTIDQLEDVLKPR